MMHTKARFSLYSVFLFCVISFLPLAEVHGEPYLPNTIRVHLFDTTDPLTIQCPDGCVLQIRDKKFYPIKKGQSIRLIWILRNTRLYKVHYFIPVGVFHTRERALAYRNRLLKEVKRRRMRIIEDQGSFRVEYGPFPSKELAEIYLKDIRKHIPDAYIRTEEGKGPEVLYVQIWTEKDIFTLSLRNLEGIKAWVQADTEPSGLIIKGKRYTGTLRFLPGERDLISVIEEISFPLYLAGVVWQELNPGQFPAYESLKAQVVAARTYALKTMQSEYFQNKPYDICSTVQCQAYGGIPDHPLFEKVRQAVKDTEGMVLFDGEDLAWTYYMSTCGGAIDAGPTFFPGSSDHILPSHGCGDDKFQADIVYFQGIVLPFSLKPSEIPWLASHSPFSWDTFTMEILGHMVRKDIQRYGWNSIPMPISGTVQDWLVWFGRMLDFTRTDNVSLFELFPLKRTRESFFSMLTIGENEKDIRLFQALIWLWEWKPELFTKLRQHPNLMHTRMDPEWGFRIWSTFIRPFVHIERIRAFFRDADEKEVRFRIPFQPDGTQMFQTMVPAHVFQTDPQEDWKTFTISRQDMEHRVLVQSWSENTILPGVLLRRGQKVELLFHNGTFAGLYVLQPPRWVQEPDGLSSYSVWHHSVRIKDILPHLREVCPDFSDKVSSLHIDERTPTGRVIRLSLVDTKGTVCELRGTTIRHVFGLRDLRFVLFSPKTQTTALEGVSFIGRGWGHGVGLCQVGAYGLALSGYTFEDILKHYYPGGKLRRLIHRTEQK